MVVYETPRLNFETWELKDFDEFAVVARDPKVMKYIADGKPWPDVRIGWFMGLQKAYQDTLGYCNWKLTNRENGELIGFCGLAPLPLADAPEIGWWLKPSYWGRGYASEAATRAVDAAFKEHSIKRLVARVYDTNERSINLMKRLGMTYDKVLDTNGIGEVLLFHTDQDTYLKHSELMG